MSNNGKMKFESVTNCVTILNVTEEVLGGKYKFRIYLTDSLGASKRYEITIEILKLYIPKQKVKIEKKEKPNFDPKSYTKATAKITTID